VKYIDLPGAIQTYKNGGNVTEYLRHSLGESANSEEIIEVAYDLQAGTYIQHFNEHRDQVNRYIGELTTILRAHVLDASTILDVGTGECTTLTGVAVGCFERADRILACDISWSRLYVGRAFATQHMPTAIRSRFHPFVASFFALPFADKSVDVTWTSHALEPNGGHERKALSELFRVTKQKLCLFEPNYEANSPEGKARMERLGYIRNLKTTAEQLGATVNDWIRIEHAINPLNPTYAFIITPPSAPASDYLWACPASHERLVPHNGFLFSQGAGLAYPVLLDIPVLRVEAAILASALLHREH
jgi:ubiquinone/menaquinone biosynthesis C-methylase UbiE